MKHLILISCCMFFLTLSAAAQEEALGKMRIHNENDYTVIFDATCCGENYYGYKAILYFNNPDGVDDWYRGITPFALAFTNKEVQLFRDALTKYDEWRDVATSNSISDIKKQIPLKEEFESSFKYCFASYFTGCRLKFHFQTTQGIMKLILEVDTYTYEALNKYITHYYYFEDRQVYELARMFSDKSLNDAMDKMNQKKAESTLFN